MNLALLVAQATTLTVLTSAVTIDEPANHWNHKSFAANTVQLIRHGNNRFLNISTRGSFDRGHTTLCPSSECRQVELSPHAVLVYAANPAPNACAVRNVDPHVVYSGKLDVPPGAERNIRPVAVAVAIDESGMPFGAKIVRAPAGPLNGALLRAANDTRFSPRIVNCEPVPSLYILRIPAPQKQ